MSQVERCPIAVMLVEDSPDDAGLVRMLLERSRAEEFHLVHHARLGPAIEQLGSGGIDLVLLDFALPDSFGLETFRRVHAAAPSVPVIVLTSLDDDEIAATAVREGAQDYLVKRELASSLLVRSIRYALERHRAEEALRVSEERFALAVRGANDGVWDWDLETGKVYLSPRWKQILGFREDEVGDRVEDWHRRVHPEDLPAMRAGLEAHCTSNGGHFELEHRMVSRDGRDRWVLTRGAAVRDRNGRAVRMAGSMTDITERKVAERQLLHDAFHDGLTGLANRALFVDRLGQILASVPRRPGTHFSVLFLDLDRFKTVNDSLGHAAGDELLVAIARRLERFVRPGDTVARLGGDEFSVLLTDAASASDAIRVAERVQEVLAEEFTIGGHPVFVTASIGIALSDSTEGSPEAILRNADIAMYRAKASGRARFEVFDREMHSSVLRLLKLETDLRRGLERGEFVMHYQPIVSLGTGRIVGFEGLVRWRHPKRGLVRPAQFIAVAEETGIIVPLGWWVLEECCEQARAWQERFPADPPLSISVNVSGKLFLQGDMVDRMVAILEQTRLLPESLRLEITESVVLDHGERVLANLQELRALGVKLGVDDFGTGYSSLSYLQRFHYDDVKIDQTFVSNLSGGPEAETIVETILSLAQGLGIGVIAEGVETAEQLKRLRSLGCPQGQGYLFARPLDAVAAGRLIADGRSW